MARSFGPCASFVDDSLEGVVACKMGSVCCTMLHGKMCTDQGREVPDASDTPDWCRFRESAAKELAKCRARDLAREARK